jgi:endonuclease III
MTNTNRITRLLLGIYPEPRLVLHFSSPLELLVAVILSAQCTDVRVNDVIRNLFRKYRHVSDYADADLTAFEEEIRSTGFYKNKAKLVINCCRKLLEDEKFRLRWTSSSPCQESAERLRTWCLATLSAPRASRSTRMCSGSPTAWALPARTMWTKSKDS